MNVEMKQNPNRLEAVALENIKNILFKNARTIVVDDRPDIRVFIDGASIGIEVTEAIDSDQGSLIASLREASKISNVQQKKEVIMNRNRRADYSFIEIDSFKGLAISCEVGNCVDSIKRAIVHKEYKSIGYESYSINALYIQYSLMSFEDSDIEEIERVIISCSCFFNLIYIDNLDCIFEFNCKKGLIEKHLIDKALQIKNATVSRSIL